MDITVSPTTWSANELQQGLAQYAEDPTYAAEFSKYNPTPGINLPT
jgi:hypothetical protein